MTRARGQSSRRLRNRDFPFQVTVVAETVRGKTLDRAISFHKANRLPIRTNSDFIDDNWYDTYCFAQRQHAESFQRLFGGELILEPPR
jgi:hypothetical protein